MLDGDGLQGLIWMVLETGRNEVTGRGGIEVVAVGASLSRLPRDGAPYHGPFGSGKTTLLSMMGYYSIPQAAGAGGGGVVSSLRKTSCLTYGKNIPGSSFNRSISFRRSPRRRIEILRLRVGARRQKETAIGLLDGGAEARARFYPRDLSGGKNSGWPLQGLAEPDNPRGQAYDVLDSTSSLVRAP